MTNESLLPLPSPDGEPFKCTRDLGIKEWPYVQRCTEPAAGLLSQTVYDTMRPHFSMGGRMVCKEHGERILKEYEYIKAGWEI